MKKGEVRGGNFYNKYQTKNPVARYLVTNFLESLDQLIEPLPVQRILEVGCGEGYLADRIFNLFKEVEVYGVDISLDIVAQAASTYPHIHFSCQSVYSLGYKEGKFDLVIASEVLEHLECPYQALCEIRRITNKYLLVSVPREPIWRVMNIVRGAYLTDWGNTPGHIQHWKLSSIVSLLKGYFDIEKILKPFPWIMVLCRILP